MAAIPKVQFSSGVKVDQLAYGTGSAWMKEVEGEIHRPTIDAIKAAIDLGYRHLDGAQYYKNETELGLAVKESGVPRSEFFITTKVFGHTDVEGQLRSSLEKLGTEYIDLYMLHEPFSAGGNPAALQTVWRDMEACHDKGLARNIGVSNFLVPHVQAVLETAKVKPAVNQMELHPYLPREELVRFCQGHGITVEAFAPLTPLTKAGPGPSTRWSRARGPAWRQRERGALEVARREGHRGHHDQLQEGAPRGVPGAAARLSAQRGRGGGD
ncbi:hypothetical protein G7054_g1154 [Neopestalotiopsis clavispora]|nr:hypothetical protein G7054_g1154 [Neopestalotiopsis clavispora]